LSEKTPDNVLVFPELLNLFPEAHFIYVIRDPRAVIASLLQVGMRSRKFGWKTPAYTHSVLPAIAYIKRCLKSGFSSHAMAPERVLAVVYERLVSDPEAETRKICEFLNVDWSKQMLYPGVVKHLGEKAVTNNVWYDTKSYNRNPEPGEIDKWKTQLTCVQQVIIATAFKDDTSLAQCGYDFSLDGCLDLSLSALIRLGRSVRHRSFTLARKGRCMVRQGLRLWPMANPK
jgi:hypothetical protein